VGYGDGVEVVKKKKANDCAISKNTNEMALSFTN
jgi:hypothetical protein